MYTLVSAAWTEDGSVPLGVTKTMTDTFFEALDLKLKQDANPEMVLLSELRLDEDDYVAAKKHMREWLTKRRLLESAPERAPLAFARMLSEFTSRLYVPRRALDQAGVGLWQNLREIAPDMEGTSAAGDAFCQSIKSLRKSFPHLALLENAGWKYVGNLLIHAGIPVRGVDIFVGALSPFFGSDIDSVPDEDLHTSIRKASGLNKYIKNAFDTAEGTLLLKQFIRLCAFVAQCQWPG
jgi:hypothetical protein